MSDDRLDAVFGVQQVAAWREPPAPPPDPTARHWDSHPIVKKVKGVEREFFLIGALAVALGRRTVTIRKWETERVIPKPRYRLKPPTIKPGKVPLPGKTLMGKRLYSREQIEGVVAAARAARVYDPRDVTSADWAEFTRLVSAIW